MACCRHWPQAWQECPQQRREELGLYLLQCSYDIAIDTFKQCPGQTSGKALYASVARRESELPKLIAHKQLLQICRCSCMKMTSQAALQSALTEHPTPYPGTLSLQVGC